mgnify:CR=1 FL=1
METNTTLLTLSGDQLAQLARRLPDEAVTPHPTKKFLSSIKSIYVTERLNEVFGVGRWCIETEIVERVDRMVVVKLKFTIPDYGIYYECYGGNDNPDLGDAYKGATTDAITKVASWLGIGADVFKGKYTNGVAPKSTQSTPATKAPKSTQSAPATAPATPTRKRITMEQLDDAIVCDQLMKWMYGFLTTANYTADFDAGARLLKSYDADAEVVDRFSALFESYRQARKNAK